MVLAGFRFFSFGLLLACVAFASPQQNSNHAQQSSAQQSGEKFDGPAELPRVWVKSDLADTPSPGRKIAVTDSGNLQNAIDNAQCGDTIEIQPGLTFQGMLRFPAKPCDDAHWITVRSGAPDSVLPPPGTRVTPCYAGVSSLPGRPDFHCASDHKVLPKIEFDAKSGAGPLDFMPGANHYRFIALEVTRGQPGTCVFALVSLGEKGGTAHHLVFDRMWMHGTAQDETTRGIPLRGMTNVAIVDSFFSDFHCVAVTGACLDSQAISGGGGDEPEGPFKIVNNYLEAAGENIIFGGGAATITPTDIEIRHNYFFKPMIWKKDTPGFVGGTSGRPFIVKNLFELKNAQRVLFEGNILQNTWGGFTQSGFSILLTPKNQGNKCPKCQVTDVTIRYNKVLSVGGVFGIGNATSDAGGTATAGERYSIHDLVAEDVRTDNGPGTFAMLVGNTPPLADVRIEHVSAFIPNRIFGIVNKSGERPKGVVISNNLFFPGGMQMGSAGGGAQNCAFHPEVQGPAGILKSCFSDPVVTHNLIVGGSGWPSGNIMVKDVAAAGLRELPGKVVPDYRLCRARNEANNCKTVSPAIGAASDGKDIGADIDRLEKMLAGVI